MIFVATCDQVDFLEILFTQLCYDEADEEVPKKYVTTALIPAVNFYIDLSPIKYSNFMEKSTRRRELKHTSGSRNPRMVHYF